MSLSPSALPWTLTAIAVFRIGRNLLGDSGVWDIMPLVRALLWLSAIPSVWVVYLLLMR